MVNAQSIEAKVRAWPGAPTWFQNFCAGEPLAQLGVDSLEAVRWISYLQKEFAVAIHFSDYVGEPFRSLENLVRFIQQKQVGVKT